MVTGELIKFALTNQAGTVLILIVAYFLIRDYFDKRYKKMNECPDKVCFDVFMTKEMHKEKEQLIDKSISNIHEEIKQMRIDIDSKFDLLISLQKDDKRG